MASRAFIRVGTAVAVAAVLLSLSALWDVFVTPSPSIECFESSPEPGAVPACGIAHYYHDPSVAEIAIRISVAILALIGVAAVSTRSVANSSILVGTAAAIATGLLALAVLVALTVGSGHIDLKWTSLAAASVCGVCLVLGLTTSHITSKWWPNKSLERTREG